MKNLVQVPKVAMISSSFYPIIGGAEQQARLLGESLSLRGYSVRVLTRQHVHGQILPRTKENVDNIQIVRLFSWGRGKIGSFFYLLSSLLYLRQTDTDIYHAHGTGVPAWIAIIASKLSGGSSIVKLRNGRAHYKDTISSKLRLFLFSFPLRRADFVIALNSDTHAFLIELGIKRENIVCIPNGVNVKFFRPPTSKEKLTARHMLDLPDKAVFLCVGSLVPRKGFDRLLEEWAALPPAVLSNSLLLFVGEGPEKHRLTEQAVRLKLDMVRFEGRREHVRNYYWASDVFVLPSRTEGLSNALLEALASGLPILANEKLPNIAELVNQNGFLFDLSKKSDITNAIVNIVNLQDQWAEMAKYSRDTAIKNYSIEAVTNKYTDLYQTVKR